MNYRYFEEIEAPTSYALDAARSWWSYVVPEESINLLPNPSWEYTYDANTTHGAKYGMKCRTASFSQTFVPTDYGIHTFSAYFMVASGIQSGNSTCYMQALDKDSNVIGSKLVSVAPDSKWHRHDIQFRIAGSSVGYSCTVRLYTVTGSLASDAWQCEMKQYATTYFDGDMGLYYPYAKDHYTWLGEPHNSQSMRSAKTRSGGRVYSFGEQKFRVTAVTGLSAPENEITTISTATGNRRVRNVIPGAREVTIAGSIYGETPELMLERQRTLLRQLGRNSKEPLLLRCSINGADEYELRCHFVGETTGELNNLHQRKMALSFVAHEDADWYGEQVEQLGSGYIDDQTNPIFFTLDLDTGAYTYPADVTPDMGGTVVAVDYGYDNLFYWVTTEGYVKRLNADMTITDLTGDLGAATLTCISVSKYAPLEIVVGGSVLKRSGGSGTWTVLGSGTNGTVNAVLYHHGVYWIGGNFTTVGSAPHSYPYLAVYWHTNMWLRPSTAIQSTSGGGITAIGLSSDRKVVVSGKWSDGTVVRYYDVFNENIGSTQYTTAQLAQIDSPPPTGAYSIVRLDGETSISIGAVDTNTYRIVRFVGDGYETDDFDTYYSSSKPGIAAWNGNVYVSGIQQSAEGYQCVLHTVNPKNISGEHVMLPLVRTNSTSATGATPVAINKSGLLLVILPGTTATYSFAQPVELSNNYDKNANAILTIGAQSIFSIYNWTTGKRAVFLQPIRMGANQKAQFYEYRGVLYMRSDDTVSAVALQPEAADSDVLTLIPGVNNLSASLSVVTSEYYSTWRWVEKHGNL